MTGEPDEGAVKVLMVLGPHSFAGDLDVLGPSDTVLGSLPARVIRVRGATERETVDALEQPCEAVVLDPGSLEHYSGQLADAVGRLDVPVVVVRDRQEHELGVMGARRCVSPAATASISGGGAVAYMGAVEAAARLAWDARRDAHGRGAAASARGEGP